jgi:hypothetical protein
MLALIRGCRLVNFDLQERAPLWPPQNQDVIVEMRRMGEAMAAARRAAAG